MRRFHTDSHRAQCCLEFSWDGNVSTCVNKIFHFAFKRYLISKTVSCFWCTLIHYIMTGGNHGFVTSRLLFFHELSFRNWLSLFTGCFIKKLTSLLLSAHDKRTNERWRRRQHSTETLTRLHVPVPRSSFCNITWWTRAPVRLPSAWAMWHEHTINRIFRNR